MTLKLSLNFAYRIFSKFEKESYLDDGNNDLDSGFKVKSHGLKVFETDLRQIGPPINNYNKSFTKNGGKKA